MDLVNEPKTNDAELVEDSSRNKVVILCHKCAGQLFAEVEGLRHCSCMSSYYQAGLSPTVSVEEAYKRQLRKQLDYLLLAVQQGRSPDQIDDAYKLVVDRIDAL